MSHGKNCGQKCLHGGCAEPKTEGRRLGISEAVAGVIRTTLLAEENRLRSVARDESIDSCQRDAASEGARELEAVTDALYAVSQLGGRIEVVFPSNPPEGLRLLRVLEPR